MAGKKTTGVYDRSAFLDRLQDIADATAELDTFLFANDVPKEDIEIAKTVLKDTSKQANEALSRRKSKINVAELASKSLPE